MTEAWTTCLVVDDEDSLRRALVRGLERAGYRVLEAASAELALEVMNDETPELVISDLRMGGMDGVALLQKIHERKPDVAVIVASAVSDVETAVACLQLGAMDYITKPFQLDEVRARVEQVLDKRRLIMENRRYQTHLAELVRQQAVRIEELFLEGVQMLVDALEAKDAYTHGHSARVSTYAGQVARKLGLSETEAQLIELGAELHDVGKIGVREAVLLKPAPLTRDEYDHLMGHTLIGARILEPLLKNAPQVISIVRSHHERLDGHGFPDHLIGDEIPIHARIVSVCDAFDAMTSGRPYRAAMVADRAMAELDACVAKQFDPEVMKAFHRAYPEIRTLPIGTPPKVRRRIPKTVTGVAVPVLPR